MAKRKQSGKALVKLPLAAPYSVGDFVEFTFINGISIDIRLVGKILGVHSDGGDERKNACYRYYKIEFIYPSSGANKNWHGTKVSQFFQETRILRKVRSGIIK